MCTENSCNARFTTQTQLKNHLSRHFKIKDYECAICNKFFSSSTSLTLHRSVHSKEKPYKCEFCSVKFTQKGNLKFHQKKFHRELITSSFNENRALETESESSNSNDLLVYTNNQDKQILNSLQNLDFNYFENSFELERYFFSI